MLIVPLGGRPGWAFPWATLDLDFAKNRGVFRGRGVSPLGLLTATQNTTVATDLLPSDASGTGFNTFAANVPRLKPGSGLLCEEARTNFLLNSRAPVTQTTGSLNTGVYTLWVNGSGTATPTAGSATITGATAATQGSPGGFTVTVAGTVTVTLSGGTPNAFQCELGTWGSSLIVTGGATATRNADAVTTTVVPTFGNTVTVFGSGTPFAPTAYATNQCIGGPSDGTTNNRLIISRAASTGVDNMLMAGGGSAGPTGATTWNQSTAGKAAIIWALSDQSIVFNGGTPVTSTTATNYSGTTQINIGSNQAGVAQWNGLISRFAIGTIRLPNSTSQVITT